MPETDPYGGYGHNGDRRGHQAEPGPPAHPANDTVPDAGEYPADQPPARARAGGSLTRGSLVFFGAAGALVLVIVAVAAVLLGSGGGAAAGGQTAHVGKPTAGGVAPQAYSSAGSTATFDKIATRAADATPLALTDVFPASGTGAVLKDTATKATLKIVAKGLDTDCAKAVWGSAVGDVLRKGQCTQVFRGLYADQAKGLAVQTTVFNLADAKAAGKLVATFAAGTGSPGFVLPLTAAAPLNTFAQQGFSTARGVAMGHYAVIAWVARLDGKGGDLDEGLMSLLVTGGQPSAVYTRAAS